MKVGTRLVLANAIPLLLVALFATWLWFSLSALSANVNEQLAQREAMALLAQDMQRDVIQVQQFLSDVSATRGQDGLDDGFQLAAQHKDGFFQHLANYAALSAQTGDASFATTEATLQAKFNAYYDQGVTMAQAYVASGPEAGNRLMGQFDEAAGSLNGELATFVKAARQALQQQMADIAERTTWLRMLAVGLVAGIGVLMFTISHWVAKGITQRLNLGLEAARAIAAGNLLQPVSAIGQDEIAALMQAMEAMRQSLGEVVGRVQAASADVANASVQIAQGDADLSNRTEQQASALEETAASMEQLRSTVLQTAENARTASGLAGHASTVATQGGEVVGQVVHTMRDINDSSRKIADIVGLIDSIAFQTNILALNAAVEAARAGEQGRGFAVVASEVRSLAGRSAHAAKEIKQLIDDSVSKVDAGTALVDRAGDTMGKVVEAINNAAAVIAEIDAATAEQSRGVAEASEAVSLMDQTTQQNAALVEEIAASASHLSDNARELVRITAAFRTGASSGPALLPA